MTLNDSISLGQKCIAAPTHPGKSFDRLLEGGRNAKERTKSEKRVALAHPANRRHGHRSSLALRNWHMSLGGVDTSFPGVPSPVFRLLTSAIIQRRGTSGKDKFLLPYPYFGGVKGFLDYYCCTNNTHCRVLYYTTHRAVSGGAANHKYPSEVGACYVAFWCRLGLLEKYQAALAQRVTLGPSSATS